MTEMYFSLHLKCDEPQYYCHTQIILGCGDEDREQTRNLFFSTPTKALYCVLLKKNNDLCNKRAQSNPRKYFHTPAHSPYHFPACVIST